MKKINKLFLLLILVIINFIVYLHQPILSLAKGFQPAFTNLATYKTQLKIAIDDYKTRARRGMDSIGDEVKEYKSYLQYIPSINRYKAKILLVHNGGWGERETIEHLKIAAKRLNVDLKTIHGKVIEGYSGTANSSGIVKKVENVIKIYRPDFVLVQEDMLGPYKGAPNYITITRGTKRYLKLALDGGGMFAGGIPHNFEQRLPRFDALLPSFYEIDLLKRAYERQGKKYFGFNWYPTLSSTDYEPATPKKLFYVGGHLWDSTRSSKKYIELFSKLDKSGYFAVCGLAEKWQHAPNSMIGLVPFDGKSLLAKLHEAGVSLLLHHREHLAGGSPTNRIFEAAAANNVIISDAHPFIKQHFGDNVLYIDIDQNAESMFKQVDAHMQWILANPLQAQQKAANCNAIYKQKFILEKQLADLLDLHKAFVQHSTS